MPSNFKSFRPFSIAKFQTSFFKKFFHQKLLKWTVIFFSNIHVTILGDKLEHMVVFRANSFEQKPFVLRNYKYWNMYDVEKDYCGKNSQKSSRNYPKTNGMPWTSLLYNNSILGVRTIPRKALSSIMKSICNIYTFTLVQLRNYTSILFNRLSTL